MDNLILLSLVALGSPLLGFVLIIFNQRALAERAHLIALPTIAFSAVLAFYVAWMKLHVLGGTAPIAWSQEWLRIGDVHGASPLVISMNILLDNITVIMMAVVTGISALVHVFSIGYMRRDARYARYFAFLGLFTFAMLGVVLSGNLFFLYFFWELVGFTSYALIGHWYERNGPQYASKKAFIVNRIGDAFFFIGILLLYSEFRTFDFREIFAYVSQGLPLSFSLFGLHPETTLTLAGLLLFAGAVAKSAQFPLFVWLPDAMEGPTPVSALIHAATMVAAGVYLVARIFPILTAKAMLVIACTGAFTSLLGATIAISQIDIKRVLAYSTISQLGLMIMAIGSGAMAAGMFHLVTHAAFKALLFLGAGSVLHAMHRALRETHDHETDANDIHNMGGFIRKMPVTGWTFFVAALAITGLPLTAGFMSKDEVLAAGVAYGTLAGGIAQAIPWVAFAATVLTALYMWRLVFRVFFGKPSNLPIYDKIKESPVVMTVPLIVLAVCTLWFWFGRNPVQPEHGWFLAKWVKTPAQVIPPQTAPPFRGGYGVQGIGYGVQGIGYGVQGIGYSSSDSDMNQNPTPYTLNPTPMPHQLALEEERAQIANRSQWVALGSAALGFLIALVFFLVRPARGAGRPRNATHDARMERADDQHPTHPRGREDGRWPYTLHPIPYALYRFSFRGWYIDPLYEYAVAGFVMLTARVLAWGDEHIIDGAVNLAGRATVLIARSAAAFDKYVIDGIVTLVGATVQFFGLMARSVQTGRVQTYLTWVIAAVLVTLLILRFALFHS